MRKRDELATPGAAARPFWEMLLLLGGMSINGDMIAATIGGGLLALVVAGVCACVALS